MVDRILSFVLANFNPKNNPEGCCHPFRFQKKCHLCIFFIRTFSKGKSPKEMKCKPKITKEVHSLLRKKMKLTERIGVLQSQLVTIDKQIYS